MYITALRLLATIAIDNRYIYAATLKTQNLPSLLPQGDEVNTTGTTVQNGATCEYPCTINSIDISID